MERQKQLWSFFQSIPTRHFISCLRSYLDTIFSETSFSCKVAIVQSKYKSLPYKFNPHDLLLTAMLNLSDVRFSPDYFPLLNSPLMVLHLPTWSLSLNEPNQMTFSNMVASLSSKFQSCIAFPFLSLDELLSWHWQNQIYNK